MSEKIIDQSDKDQQPVPGATLETAIPIDDDLYDKISDPNKHTDDYSWLPESLVTAGSAYGGRAFIERATPKENVLPDGSKIKYSIAQICVDPSDLGTVVHQEAGPTYWLRNADGSVEEAHYEDAA